MSLRNAVLIALQNEEGTGYEIAKWFDQGMGYFWAATHQQIYLELKKMTELKLVTFKEIQQQGKPAKKVYSVTPEGQRALKTWLEEPTKHQPVKDALLMKIYSAHLADPSVLLKDIENYRNETKQTLEKFRSIEQHFFSAPNKLSLQQQYVYFTLKNGITHALAALQWSEEIIQFLKKQVQKTS